MAQRPVIDLATRPSLEELKQLIHAPIPTNSTVFASPTVKIIAWNVNGLSKAVKSAEFALLLSAEAPDILICSELRLVRGEVEGIRRQIEGYPHYYMTLKQGHKRHAGLLVLSKVAPEGVRSGVPYVDYDSTGHLLTLRFNELFIVAAYFPSSGGRCRNLEFRVRQWDCDVRNYITSLDSQKPVVLIGDLNVVSTELDYSRHPGQDVPGFHSDELQSFRHTLALGFADSYRELNPQLQQFTWRSHRCFMVASGFPPWKSRLDYAVVSSRILPWVQTSSVLDSYKLVSDHCPVSLVLQKPSE
jgi:exodeoxyribonuclease-3